jgi:hypothetical protein
MNNTGLREKDEKLSAARFVPITQINSRTSAFIRANLLRKLFHYIYAARYKAKHTLINFSFLEQFKIEYTCGNLCGKRAC